MFRAPVPRPDSAGRGLSPGPGHDAQGIAMTADTINLDTSSRTPLLSSDLAARLASGVAFGLLIGLVPKDSLLVWMFGVLLMLTTANLATAAVSGFVFSWVGWMLDPFTHKLGGLVLTANSLDSTWTWLYGLPLVPWTRFNNTVVMGSLLTGLLLLIPVWMVSFRFFRVWGIPLHGRLQKSWVYRWLFAPPSTPALEEGS